MEAPPHLTDAYAHLNLAIGFGRLGAQTRARELEDHAFVALAPVVNDPVHQLLTSWLCHRLDEACAGRSCRSNAPSRFIESLGRMNRAQQYKVWRLLDQTRQFEPNARPATTEPMSLMFGGTRELDAPDPLLALAAVPTEVAFEDLAAAITEATRGPATAAARACYVAARHGFTELVIGHVPTLAGCSETELETSLRFLVRALVWCDLRDELATAIATIEPSPTRPRALQRIVDAVNAFLGQPADDLIAEAENLDHLNMVLPTRLVETRSLATAATYAGPEVGGKMLTALAKRFVRITDSYGTNSHYCLSVLDFIDSLSIGHTELALAATHTIAERATEFIY